MSHIQAVGWIDTWLISSRLRQLYFDRFEGDGDVQTLHLLDEDGENLPILNGEKGWKGASTFLKRLSNDAAPFMGGLPADLGAVWIDRLRPNGKTPWTQIDDPDWLQFRIALFSPPGAWFYVGGEALVLGVGTINYINTAALHSRVNFSNAPCVHLVANVRRPPSP